VDTRARQCARMRKAKPQFESATPCFLAGTSVKTSTCFSLCLVMFPPSTLTLRRVQRRCDTCNGNHKCSVMCEKSLFCGHVCNNTCHDKAACQPCNRKCDRKCSHSSCPKMCCESVSTMIHSSLQFCLTLSEPFPHH
jgi:hypothetical protein